LESYKIEETVYLHIKGIGLDTDFNLGNITILKATESNLKNRPAEKLLKRRKEDYFGQVLNKNMENDFWGAALSEYKVVAEPQRAFERAKDETRRALEILRFASKSIYPIDDDIRIGLEDEQSYSSKVAFIVSDKRISLKKDSEGTFKSFEINSEVKKKLEEIGVFVLSDILKKKNATDYEEALLRAVHWFSSALLQSELENAFLSMIIALETLFTAKDRDPIATTIAEGVALLLSEELETRKKIKKAVKYYYGMRNGISHGGKENVMESEYFRLMDIVRSIIMKLTERINDFSDRISFLDWIEDLKLR